VRAFHLDDGRVVLGGGEVPWILDVSEPVRLNQAIVAYWDQDEINQAGETVLPGGVAKSPPGMWLVPVEGVGDPAAMDLIGPVGVPPIEVVSVERHGNEGYRVGVRSSRSDLVLYRIFDGEKWSKAE
jgi:hypothetical protein